jgi:hypothetical protein
MAIASTSAITAAILQDRQQRKKISQKPFRSRLPSDGFDPFSITRWRVVAGGDPGYLPKAQMRMGSTGSFIACQCCAREFESRGWKYCPKCMELPAEERRDQPKPSGRRCGNPGCDQRLSMRARTDARYCSPACRKAASRDKTACKLPDTAPPEMSQLDGSKTRIERAFISSPSDWPANLIGGDRRGRSLPPDLVETIIKRETP